jgi:TRAP-type C4-dicarboxylate transport system substrate-binding protein
MADTSFLAMNTTHFNSLSEADQKTILDAGKIWEDTNVKEDSAYFDYAYDEMVKSGVEFYELTDEDKVGFREAVQSVYDSAKSSYGEERYNKFMEELEAAR